MTIDQNDLPDECPKCGADLTVDRLTDHDDLHALRRYYTFEKHMTDEHPVIWFVAEKVARITVKIQQILRKFKP